VLTLAAILTLIVSSKLLTIMGRAEPPRTMKCRLAPDPSLIPTLSRRARERTRCANFIVIFALAFQGALLMTILAGFAFGIDPIEQPALVVTGAIVAIAVTQLLLQHLFTHLTGPLRQAIEVHLYNGLYVDILVTRLITRLWPTPGRAATVAG